MKIFIEYIKYRLKSIFAFTLFTLIFAVIFSLYDIEKEAVIYSCMLCIAAGAVLCALDYITFKKRHAKLLELKNQILISMDEIPDVQNIIEYDYQTLLKELFSENRRIYNAAEKGMQDTVDYYTLWAHQIKTPIAAARLILQSDESKQNKELLAELFKIEQYVEMVLAYLRLGSNTNDFVIKKYNVDNIVKQALRKYASIFIKSKVSVKLDIPSDGNVITDEKWLEFCVEQILSNAVKYTPAGGTVSIKFYKDRLSVTDTSIGIARQDLPRICEKDLPVITVGQIKNHPESASILQNRSLQDLGMTLSLMQRQGKAPA